MDPSGLPASCQELSQLKAYVQDERCSLLLANPSLLLAQRLWSGMSLQCQATSETRPDVDVEGCGGLWADFGATLSRLQADLGPTMDQNQNLSVETLNYQLSTGNKIDVAICYSGDQPLSLLHTHPTDEILACEPSPLCDGPLATCMALSLEDREAIFCALWRKSSLYGS